MRLKALLALGTAAAMILSVTAVTYALFSATTSGGNNDFVAGTVSLNSWRDLGDTINGPMFYTTPLEGATPGGVLGLKPTGLWAPGDQHMRVLLVRNTGTLAAKMTKVGATIHPGTSMYLAQKLQWKLTSDGSGLNVLASGTLADVINSDQAFSAPIPINPSPAPKPLFFWVELPLNADNSYQNLTLMVDFHVYAEQLANNP